MDLEAVECISVLIFPSVVLSYHLNSAQKGLISLELS